MRTQNLRRLLERLNEHTTHALEAATGLCVQREHYEVTIEHLLLKLLEDGGGDLPRLFEHFGVEGGRVQKALQQTLESLRTGNTGRPTFSPQLLELIEEAWLMASVHHGLREVRSGTLLEALLTNEALQTRPYVERLKAMEREGLREQFADLVAGSDEDPTAGRAAAQAARDGRPASDSALEQFTLDVTGRARAGEIDPVFGRNREIRQIIDILSRRRKNNPILVGEAGVGKTAVVEGLALRIAEGDVPERLAELDLRTLDLGLLQAGASMKGAFEERLKSVIEEVKAAPRPTVLFIDEAHTLIGAGGAEGTGDAANLLKPALARGELRTVAATTWTEYKKHIEKDPALERRFQRVKIEEPSPEDTAVMLRGLKSIYETHHGVTVTDEAVEATAELAGRYITGRQLPDKAVDLLDTAAARVKMTLTARPGRLDDLDRRLQHLDTELAGRRRDLRTGVVAEDDTLEALEQNRVRLEDEREDLEARWNRERELAHRITAARARLVDTAPVIAGGAGEVGEEAQEKRFAPPGADAAEAVRSGRASSDGASSDGAPLEDLDTLQRSLADLQGEAPMVFPEVTSRTVAQVVSDWTGIPVGNMMQDEAQTLLRLEERLGERILGQEEALREVSETVRTAKAGLGNPHAPLAVFLFAGPSGVGKTETALALADELFGGERFMSTINMSEYQEKHTASQLKGSPPGYVGYGEGGVLTEAVRQRPYSVVLLDEVEKAHRDVMNLFYQVFDKGFMRDGEGREIDFKNTIIIMTSNLGTDTITSLGMSGERPPLDEVREAIHPVLVEHFQPALLGRMKVVPYRLLDRETMQRITELKLGRVGRRLQATHDVDFEYDDAVPPRIAARCTQIDAGARNVDFIIDRTVLPQAARALITQMTEEEEPKRLTLGLSEEGDFTYTFE